MIRYSVKLTLPFSIFVGMPIPRGSTIPSPSFLLILAKILGAIKDLNSFSNSARDVSVKKNGEKLLTLICSALS